MSAVSDEMVEETKEERSPVTPAGTELIWHSDRLISIFGNYTSDRDQNLSVTCSFSQLNDLTVRTVAVAYLCLYAGQIHGLRI